MEHTYWQKQTLSKPLFPNIEFSKPERRDLAGKLAIIGGNKLGFAAVAENYQLSLQTGAGKARVLLPDCLKSTVPAILSDVIFAPSTSSGGLNQEAITELSAVSSWADGVLLIGDAGRNAETALVYEQFVQNYAGPLTITRDAVDLIKNNPRLLTEREDTLIVASFAQLQKLFQGVYYPKVLTFNMQLLQLVEALHKFTTTYPCTIMTLHRETMIVAHGGNVITQPWDNPMTIWRGSVATKAACYWLWNQKQPLEAAASSLMN